MRTRSIAAIAVTAFSVALVTLLGACGGEGGGGIEPTGSPSSPATGSPPVTPSPPATTPTLPSRPPVSPVPPPPTDKPGQTTTLTGEVYAGVEANCKLLRTGSGDYLLFGEAAESARLGSTVTVRGQIRADMASTCQQGTPFEVSEVVPD